MSFNKKHSAAFTVAVGKAMMKFDMVHTDILYSLNGHNNAISDYINRKMRKEGINKPVNIKQMKSIFGDSYDIS